MRAALLILIGAVFSGLFLVLPATHAARWLDAPLDGVAWAAVALPFALLPFAATTRRAWISLWAWPTAHLPAVLLAPALTAPAIYAGRSGLWATLALAVAMAAWVIVALWPRRRAATLDPAAAGRLGSGRLGPVMHPLALLSLVLTLAIYLAFAQAAFGVADTEPLAANLALLAGAAVASWVAIHAVASGLGGVVFEPAARRRLRAGLLMSRRPTRRRLVVIFATGALLMALVVAWYLVRPQ